MKRQTNSTLPRYILGKQLPENSILGAIGTETITTNGISYTDDFTTEFAKAIVRYFKNNLSKLQNKGESA